ncbi:2-C-methyl-D-erythritol 4-phosphate cytidylyltransferase [Actinophytocola sp.]|uniref:IspD/TarI family cytidylyltransferase n=1 Tax=Actinophytocola sp. TaxID=1872138 RepID=UPI00389A9C40
MVPLHGLPLIAHAVRGLLSAGCVRHVVVAAPPDHVAEVSAALASFEAVSVVAGGADRVASVRLALGAALTRVPAAEIALVHDVDRALTPSALVRSVADAVADGNPAVVPVLPVTDTVKRVAPSGVILDTPDRTDLRSLQSPQGFAVDVLLRACAAGGVLEKVDVPVLTVPGDIAAMKITTPFDLTVAEAVVAG